MAVLLPLTDLGPRTPASIAYLQRESILPEHLQPGQYTLHSYVEDTEDGTPEEVVYTDHYVVWAQANTVKRVFRFNHDSDRVEHALLTWFPAESKSSGNIGMNRRHTQQANSSEFLAGLRQGTAKRDRALVILLDRKAHIFFSAGPSHTITIPFDVEKVFAAPRGILIQRKLSEAKPVPASPLLPKVPTNSFWSPQRENTRHSYSRASNKLSSRNKGGDNLTLQDFTLGAQTSPTDDLPRLFALVDPLADIGLVGMFASNHDIDRQDSLQSAHRDLFACPEYEEILYISPVCELGSGQDTPGDHLLLALTVNKIRRVYSLWQVSYSVPFEQDALKKALNVGGSPTSRSRRRSSFAPRLSTGGLTPVQKPRPKRESGAHKQADVIQAENNINHALEALDGADDFNLVASIEEPFDRHSKKSKADRRTSSMMARAELSSQDQPNFAELARNPTSSHSSLRANTRPDQSIGSIGDRISFGRSRLSGRASASGDTAQLSDVDEMATIADSMGDDLDLLDLDATEVLNHAPLDVLRRELRLSHVISIPFHDRPREGNLALPVPCEDTRAFIASDMPSASAHSPSARTININVHFPTLKMLAEIECSFPPARDHQKFYSTSKHRLPPRVRVYPGMMDAMRLSDGALARTICLMESNASSGSAPCIAVDTLQKSETSKDFRFTPLSTTVPLPMTARFAHKGPDATFSMHTGGLSPSSFQFELAPQSRQVASHLRALQSTLDSSGTTGILLHSLWLFYKHGVNTTHDPLCSTDWQALAMALLTAVLSVVGINNISKTQNTTRKGALSPLPRIPSSINRSHYLPAWQDLEKSSAGSVEQPTRLNVVAECVEAVIHCWKESNAIRALANTFSQQPHGNISSGSVVASLIRACQILHEEGCLDVLSQHDDLRSPSLLDIIDSICVWTGWDSSNSKPSNKADAFSRFDLLQWIDSGIRRKSFGSVPLSQPSLEQPGAEATEKQLLYKAQDILNPFTPRLAVVTGMLRQTYHLSSDHIVELMISLGLTIHILETLPEAIAGALRNHIRRAQRSPPTDWFSLANFEIIGRQDLDLLIRGQSPHFRVYETEQAPRYNDINTICRDLVKVTETHNKPMSFRKSSLTETKTSMSMIYREDRRWLEASKILNPLRIAVAAILPKPGCSEAEFLDEQKNLAQLIYKRTMAIPTGSAIINFGSHQPMLTEKIEIYPFNTTCNMQPSNNTVNADKSNFTEEKVSWAFFHAGVHAGLRIRADTQGIDTSWLVLNRPTDLGNRHAGLLFALGLNGHLKSMAKWLAFKYLTPKHNMTSIGLLLGLSASHMGTMDSLVTRLLSVHVTRLLPPGAAELNLSSLTQTAGIMGVGLLYYNSQHRRMSEVMLSELESIGEDGSPDSPGAFRDEGYRLAAGFSLGLINLGKGRDARTLHDMRLIERLLAVAKGSRSIDLVHVLDQATAGATMAIAMIFMKSQNARLANEIGIPMNVQQFDYIRPDILLLRTVASNLIMWNDIKPEPQWINDKVPVEYRGESADETLLKILNDKPLESSRIPMYNILAGLCWSIALKHAGQVPGSLDALAILLNFFDMVTRVLEHVNPGMLTYDELLTRDAMLRFQHLLALSMATVVAGSGDLAVFRRLRYLHGTIQADQTFGLHQACHMAIGILFMGQGRYTFSTSDLAIASLLCAFYPLFPKDVLDNRAHLQALRHLWVFAAEPRCLMVTDLDKRQPVVAPISVHLTDGTELNLEAPCLLPPIHLIQVVEIRSPDHWHVVLNFANNPAHLAAFVKHQTVALRRKDVLTRQPSAFGTAMAAVRHYQDKDRLQRSGSKGSKMFGDNAFDWIFKAPAFPASAISRAHAQLGLLGTRKGDARDASDEDKDALMRTLLDGRITATDDALVLATDARSSSDVSRLMGLKLMLDWAEMEQAEQKDVPETWIRTEWLDALKRLIAARMLHEVRSAAVQKADETTEVMDTT